jgi:hypothetical protein
MPPAGWLTPAGFHRAAVSAARRLAQPALRDPFARRAADTAFRLGYAVLNWTNTLTYPSLKTLRPVVLIAGTLGTMTT